MTAARAANRARAIEDLRGGRDRQVGATARSLRAATYLRLNPGDGETRYDAPARVTDIVRGPARQEEFVARAKRTDRTEARRRHRAELAGPDVDQTAEGTPETVPGRGRPAPAQGQPAARPGIMASFRNAYHPIRLRDDLAAAPKILTHWGVLAAAGIAIVSTAVFIMATADLAGSLDFSLSDPLQGRQIGTASNISYLVISMFVTPPPAAGAFLIGFTAKRASWLGGLAFGIVAAICYAAVLMSPAGRLLTAGTPTGPFVLQAAALAPIGAALFAAAAAWYRRFLDLANPNRGRPRPQQGRGNPKQKDRPMVSRAADRRR
jgi:hypothetical protein